GVQWWLSGLTNNSNAGSGTGFQYGPEYQGNTSDRHRVSLGGGGPQSLNGGGPGAFYSYLNKNFQVALNALEKSGNSKILSSPSLVVMNNQQAQLTVGTQVSVISTSFLGIGGYGTTSGTGTGITNSGIGQANYISTGVTLSITPRVNPGGLVYMDVSQEDTSPDYSTVTANNPNPAINQRNLDTQVAVQSGQTVLLGGMIQDQDGDSRNGVPGLSKIPVLGSLFGSTSKTRQRTELIVLITPRVITSSDEAQQMTQEYEQKFESLAPLRARNTVPASSQAPAPAQAAPTKPEPAASQENPQGEK
ncbi:MAG: type II secretion system protein GspD, partial [Deltaproteobacteria bacterium]